MGFTTSVALQVTSAVLVVAGFLLFVVAKWLLMRESRGQTLRAYVEDNQYDRSLPVGVKFIFGLLCVSIAKGSFSALVCVKVYGVHYLRADFSVVCGW